MELTDSIDEVNQDSMILVRKAQQGDREALLQLITARRNEYYRLAYVYLKNREDALDALEDMIVALYENIRGLRKEEAFYSWSKTILINCCKAMLRQRNKVIQLSAVPEQGWDGDYPQKEQRLLLDKHLAQLSVKHQDVIKLRYYLDLEYETIAEIIKIPLGTVKSRLYTALKQLRRNLGGETLE